MTLNLHVKFIAAAVVYEITDFLDLEVVFILKISAQNATYLENFD